MGFADLKTHHKAPYPAISPKRPELSQAGRTVLITGGNGGIGFAICRSFIAASASRVVFIGRGKEKVELAASRLVAEGQAMGSPTIVDGRVCDASDIVSTAALWGGLKTEGIFVDVLILNAAAFGEAKPLLETGRDKVWQDYVTNVRSHLDFAERLYKQEGKGASERKVLAGSSTVTKSPSADSLPVSDPRVHRVHIHVVGRNPSNVIVRLDKECGNRPDASDREGCHPPGAADRQHPPWKRAVGYGASCGFR